MRKFFKSTKFKILCVFLAFLLGIMVYGVSKGGYSLSGASVINTISKPFRSASNRLSTRFDQYFDKIDNYTKYYNENLILKSELTKLKQELAEYEALKAEVTELRKFVTIKEEHEDYVLSEPCKVISYITNDPFRSFTINKGSEEGIEPYCPVATADGLIGITVDVSDHSSTVRTILSPDLSIAAVSSASAADAGLVEGSVACAEKGRTRLNLVDMKNQLKDGDLMVTTGSSGLFPKGYAIGFVKDVKLDSNGLSYCAEIEPCVDVARLTSVIVITDFSGKKEVADDED